MKRVIEEAKKCLYDVPVGAMILKEGEIIALEHNKKEEDKDVTAHAEILAIRAAQKYLNTFRLTECEMYVTLEPCPMCAWAILQSGISRLYFGSYNSQYGAFSSILDLKKIANSKIEVFGGILENECDILLESFFDKIRSKRSSK